MQQPAPCSFPRLSLRPPDYDPSTQRGTPHVELPGETLRVPWQRLWWLQRLGGVREQRSHQLRLHLLPKSVCLGVVGWPPQTKGLRQRRAHHGHVGEPVAAPGRATSEESGTSQPLSLWCTMLCVRIQATRCNLRNKIVSDFNSIFSIFYN